MTTQALTPLPDFLRPYFWEVDFEGLRLPERETYILERLLEYGDDHAIQWLKEHFSAEDIAYVVRHSRRISPNTANLWALMFDIPREEIKCFSKPFPQTLGSF